MSKPVEREPREKKGRPHAFTVQWVDCSRTENPARASDRDRGRKRG